MKSNTPKDRIKRFTELAIGRREERLRADALFTSVGEGIITTNEKGYIERVNEAAFTILGCKSSELIGKWFPEVIKAVHADGTPINKIDRPITKAFLTGKPVAERTYYKKSDDSIVPVHVNVAPIIYRNKPIGAIEIFRDISLEIQVDKIKSEFISLASHQLRTPLSAINTYTHLLSEGYAGDLNKTQIEFLDTILNSVDRMNKLINTLLNVTRVEAGTITVTPKQLDLVKLGNDVLKESRVEAIENDIKLSFNAKQPIPKIKTDGLLVKEVLSNLLSNAVKYSKPGGTVQLKLSTKGGNLVYEVKDNGYGIPESAKRYIFSKFFRASNVLERDVGGTGLGLYLTKIIAENLDGEIWFKSEQDKGTSFYLSLPKQGVQGKRGKFKLETI